MNTWKKEPPKGPPLDRCANRRRDKDWLKKQLQDETTQLLPIHGKHHFIPMEDAETTIALPLKSHASLLDEAETAVFLGTKEATAYFALDLTNQEQDKAAALCGQGRFEDLRRLATMIPWDKSALLAYARAMVHWHRGHGFCSRCGHEAALKEAGHLRRCVNPDCQTESYPRTDPAVIMLVEHKEPGKQARCLLGRNIRAPEGCFSTLAGFVEPGESLEEAVAREVLEEAGIEVGDVVYQGSQPWPFPASLMLGFRARAITTTIRVDQDEMAEAHWFTAQDIATAGEWGDPGPGLKLSRRDSIARMLIETWAAEQPK